MCQHTHHLSFFKLAIVRHFQDLQRQVWQHINALSE